MDIDFSLTPLFLETQKDNRRDCINTEYIITNTSGRNILTLALLQAGTGDINYSEKVSWHESGHSAWYDYRSHAGRRGNFINLNYNDINYSSIGGSGSLDNVRMKKHNHYWSVKRDRSGGLIHARWQSSGWQHWNNFKIARKGQRKMVVLYFKKDTQMRVNFTTYKSQAGERGYVSIQPLF